MSILKTPAKVDGWFYEKMLDDERKYSDELVAIIVRNNKRQSRNQLMAYALGMIVGMAFGLWLAIDRGQDRSHQAAEAQDASQRR